MRIVFLTVHDATSRRKVDFHFWGNVIERKHHLDFVTVGFSYLTNLKPNGRKYGGPYNRWINLKTSREGLSSRKYLWRSFFHPMRSGNQHIDKLTSPVFSKYPSIFPKDVLSGISDMDVCVVENGAGLLLVPYLKEKMPNAKFIYNVCDRIETLGYHPSILEAEAAALPLFDKIRVPAKVMLEDFSKYSDKADYIPHGLDKAGFTEVYKSPYTTNKNVVSVGDMLFDPEAIVSLAKSYPDWTFHLFGRGAVIPTPMDNVIMYGERVFLDIIPYIQHADIGLAPYKKAVNADYLSQSSMKMIQYTFCRLPIVAPNFAASGRNHVMGYEPDQANSIVQAMSKAISYDRMTIDVSDVMSWEDTVDRLITFKSKTASA